MERVTETRSVYNEHFVKLINSYSFMFTSPERNYEYERARQKNSYISATNKELNVEARMF